MRYEVHSMAKTTIRGYIGCAKVLVRVVSLFRTWSQRIRCQNTRSFVEAVHKSRDNDKMFVSNFLLLSYEPVIFKGFEDLAK